MALERVNAVRLTSLAYFGGGLAKKGLGYFARYAAWLQQAVEIICWKKRDHARPPHKGGCKMPLYRGEANPDPAAHQHLGGLHQAVWDSE